MSAGTDPFGDAFDRPGHRMEASPARLDTIGWFIVTAHGLLGHGKVAALIGQPPGDQDACLICAFERYPSELNRQAVLRALRP